MTPLSRLDMEECPKGVPADVWTLFVREADKVWNAGRKKYSARVIAEYLRHWMAITYADREYKINNNDVPKMARAYARMRSRYGFFEFREIKRAA